MFPISPGKDVPQFPEEKWVVKKSALKGVLNNSSRRVAERAENAHELAAPPLVAMGDEALRITIPPDATPLFVCVHHLGV